MSANWANEGGGSAGDSSDYVSSSVSVDVASSNLPEAEKAAENVARALAILEEELGDLPSSTLISWDGETMSAAQALNILNTTKWVITDQTEFYNGGVGSADYLNDTDYLYYGAFDGAGEEDWAHPNYQNDEGLIAILLHEIGHLSDEGATRHAAGYDFYVEEEGNDLGYIGSEYYDNNEEFASDFAHAAAEAFGRSLSSVDLPYYDGTFSWRPSFIHSKNTMEASPELFPEIVIA